MLRSRSSNFCVLILLTLALLGARIVWIVRVPDVDMDAYGHFSIGRGLAQKPLDLAAHWVWLPLYHYVLAAIVLAKGTFTSVRVISAVLASALPLALYGYEKNRPARDLPPRDSTSAGLKMGQHAAMACALASIPNLLGVSAQQEALFAVLVLLSAWAIDAQRPTTAGIVLALACLVRYEAWGACALALAQPIVARSLHRYAPASRVSALVGAPLSFRVSAPPLLAIVGFVSVHRWVDGAWFAFLRELSRFTHAQRDVLSQGTMMELLWFPVLVPLLAFGPIVVLAPWGLRSAARPGWIVPLGIYAFLLASYASKSALGGERYYAALTPFFCLAIAHGAEAVARGPRSRRALQVLLILSLTATTVTSFARLGATARAHADTLRAAETRMAL